jgi:glutamyl-tRNA reductase
MQIGILGINHKLANLKLRESLAQACQRRFSAGNSNHGDAQKFVLLSTCNRTEIYFSSKSLPETHTYLLNILRQEVKEDFDQKLYSYFGRDCFHHLCRVAAGLDSAIVGETEILGQVKNAYEYASQYISLPEQLHYLFQKGLKVGKEVRSTLTMQRGLPDLEHAILNAGMQNFSQLNSIKILFIGASDINHKVLTFLKGKGLPEITLCNRSLNVANEMAKAYGLQILPWERLNDWKFFDWIVCGTKASKCLIQPQELAGNRKLLIDLSVPRNIDPAIKDQEGVTLLNIDEINESLSVRRQQMSEAIALAEGLVNTLSQRQIELKFAADKRRKMHSAESKLSQGFPQFATPWLHCGL